MRSENSRWIKSSRSSGADNCVAVRLGETVAVRHSKNPSGLNLLFTASEWTDLLGEIRNHKLDWRTVAVSGWLAPGAEAMPGARVRLLADGVCLRHSANPEDTYLGFTPVEWTAFTAGVRLGEFDVAATASDHSQPPDEAADPVIVCANHGAPGDAQDAASLR